MPEAHRGRVTLHQACACPADAILAAVARRDVGLVVITAGGETADAEPSPRYAVGHVTHAVIEQSPVPVLLLPRRYRERLPWERMLVPMSGEVEADEALGLAVRLAEALDVEVHVAHVVDTGTGRDLAHRAPYADALHHEYPYRLENLVRCAVPCASAAERRRIVDVSLCCGDVAAELLALVERKRMSLAVLGWHGRFVRGHARVVRRLIEEITVPALLVKAGARSPARLKVGEALE